MLYIQKNLLNTYEHFFTNRIEKKTELIDTITRNKSQSNKNHLETRRYPNNINQTSNNITQKQYSALEQF